MAVMAVSGTSKSAPNSRRTKPRLAVRGRRRKAVRKLLNALRVVRDQDGAETTKAENAGYVPFLFMMSGTKPTDQDYAKVIARCNAVLNATL